MSSNRTILRFNLALDCILLAIVQLRATVVTPMCCPPALRLRVVPPVRRRRPRKRRQSSRRQARAFKALEFVTKIIEVRQIQWARHMASVDTDVDMPLPSPSPVSSVEFIMDHPPNIAARMPSTSFAPQVSIPAVMQVPTTAPLHLAPDCFRPEQVKRRAIAVTRPYSPPPLDDQYIHSANTALQLMGLPPLPPPSPPSTFRPVQLPSVVVVPTTRAVEPSPPPSVNRRPRCPKPRKPRDPDFNPEFFQ